MAKIPVTDCPAGPALDAAVAKIRGDEKRLVWRCVLEGHWIDGDPETGWCYDCRELVSDGEKVPEPDRPVSQHIAAAWELVEFASVPEPGVDAIDGQSCTVLRFGFRISRALKEDTGSLDDEWGYAATFMPQELVMPHRAWAPTAPLAITRAFLLAHGVTEVEVPHD